jgi:signal transduction histidine kinase
VAPDERERIFERFFRGARDRGSADGFGLGLPLTRDIVRALGGDVRLDESATPVGDASARFVLELPRASTPVAPTSST